MEMHRILFMLLIVAVAWAVTKALTASMSLSPDYFHRKQNYGTNWSF